MNNFLFLDLSVSLFNQPAGDVTSARQRLASRRLASFHVMGVGRFSRTRCQTKGAASCSGVVSGIGEKLSSSSIRPFSRNHLKTRPV